MRAWFGRRVWGCEDGMWLEHGGHVKCRMCRERGSILEEIYVEELSQLDLISETNWTHHLIPGW